MRNLRNISHKIGETAFEITSVCWDAGKDEVLVTCGPSKHDAKIELLRVVEDAGLHDRSKPLSVQFSSNNLDLVNTDSTNMGPDNASG